MLVIIVLLAVLTFGSQVVLSSSFKFSLASVEQCGPVAVSFSGNRPPAGNLPLTLTLLPFNSTPVSVLIPIAALTSPTVWVTSIPIQEGTTFIAALEDATGVPYGISSDILKVQPSPNGNSTCLQSVDPSPRRFSISGPISQCQPFGVTYNTTLANNLSIRVFRPLHSSFALNETDPSSDGTDSYLMSASRQTEVALLFDDGFGYRELSDLLEVGGDSSSDDSCVRARLASSALMEMDQQGASNKAVPSRSAVIGISIVVGFVVGGLAILMTMYISREQRRRRELRLSEFVRSQTGRRKRSTSNILSTGAGRYVSLPYASEKAPSAPASQFISYAEDGGRSFTDATNCSDSHLGTIRQNALEKARESAAGSVASLSVDNHSLSSLDIEHILDMATIYSEPPLPPPPVAVQLSPSPTDSPFPRHLRDPSDVPTDLSPHQSFLTLFPSRISNGSYSASQRLTVTSQSRLSLYNPMSARQTRGTGLPTSFLMLPPRASERVSSFPVSVTSSLPPGDVV